MMSLSLKKCFRDVYFAVIDSLQGENIIKNCVKIAHNRLIVKPYLIDERSYDFELSKRNLLILGAGKATLSLTVGFLKVLDSYNSSNLHDSIDVKRGTIIIPFGSHVEAQHHKLLEKYNIELFFGAKNNLPDQDSVDATQRLLNMVDESNEDASSNNHHPNLFLTFITGGASALLVAPKPPLTLDQKREITCQLMKAGFTINELNQVRRKLSLVKGGQLAKRILGKNPQSQVVSLIASDVIGDPLSIIGSGPTCPPELHESTVEVVHRALQKLSIPDENNFISSILDNQSEERVNFHDRLHNVIILNNMLALKVAREKIEKLGFRLVDLGTCIQGEASKVGEKLAELVKSYDGKDAVCWIGGGETTVTIDSSSHGRGGRCQEMGLKFLVETLSLKDAKIMIMAAGTDGQDGSTPVAGVIYQPEDLKSELSTEYIRESAVAHLTSHNSYTFWSDNAPDSLLDTNGPTGVNVMDLYCVLRSA